MYYYSRLLKPRFLLVWALIGHYKVLFRPIGTEIFTFCKTSQLRLETSIIRINYTKKLYITTPDF